MDLSQGICILCTNNTKIIIPPQAEDTTALLKDILADQIDEKFDKVNISLKVCPGCLHDLITVANLKQNIKKDFSKDRKNCALCYSDQRLVSITNYPSFDQALENITSEKIRGKSSACLNCIKCLELMERIKMNLFKKYPHLKHTHIGKDDKKVKKSPTKNNPHTYENVQKNKHSSKVERFSDEEPEYFSLSKRKNVNNPKAALKHLKPLKNTRFATDKLKADSKLLKQIAFVKLSISSLSTKNYQKLSGKSNGSEKSNKSSNLSDTDSSRDSPSSKQSFFKIKLKVNSTKIKSQRVTHGKVTKPKSHKNKHLSESQQELYVRIIRMNLDEDEHCKKDREITTPTKASRKMMPDDPLSSTKKRKSVTFADELDSDITDVSIRKDNVESTPLKSLLKKNDSSKSGLLKNGDGGSSDEFDNEINKQIKQAERILDSEEELETAKSYVDVILKNNDDIFDSLKTTQDPVSAKITKNKSSFGVDKSSSSSDSDDQEINKCVDKIVKRSKNKEQNGVDNEENSKSIEMNSSNSENDTVQNEEDKSNNKAEKKTGKKSTKFKRITDNSSDSDVNENIESIGEETTSNIKNNEKDEVIEIVEKRSDNSNDNEQKDNEQIIDDPTTESKNDTSKLNNKNEKKIHLNRSRKSKKSRSKTHKKTNESNSGALANKDDDGKYLPQHDDSVMASSPEKSEAEISEVDHEISLSKCLRDKNPDDESCSGTSMDDREVTLEEFKKLKKSNSVEDAEIEEIDGKKNLHEDIICDANEAMEDKCPQIKQESDTELDSDTSNKEATTESSHLSSKYKRRSRSKIDEEPMDVNEDIEDSDGPETKKQKVSEVDDPNNTDSEEGTETPKTTTNEDTSLGVPEQRKDVGTVDDKIDELIAQYTNPSSPKLNNDNNVSDSQDGRVGREDQEEARSEVCSKESEEAVDLDTNVMVKSTEIAVEHSSESDITIDNGVPDANSVTLKDLDLNNILDNTVDSC